MQIKKGVYNNLKKGIITLSKREDGAFLCSILLEDSKKTYQLDSKNCRLALRVLWDELYGELLSEKELLEMVSYLEIECFKSKRVTKLCHRVCRKGKSKLIYQLNLDENKSLLIENGECSIIDTPDFCFDSGSNFKNQVIPDLEVDSDELLPYMDKHFNVRNTDDLILLTILVVSSMLGMGFNHPVILIQGEKGSGKSECLRKLEMIIDPKNSGICTYTNSKEAIVLRLTNSYFTCFDNVSYISGAISDLFCSAVTGSCDSARKLYTDSEERILNLHAIIALTSINVVARSSDLVDRSCLILLSRFKASEIKTEAEIMSSFRKDLPKLLGGIFNTIAKVLEDRKKVTVKKKIRLADFHEMAIRIGRALGIKEREVNRILFQNRFELSLNILEASSVATCLIELMKDKSNYESTPTNCLNDLKAIAKRKGIDLSTLPKDASRLTRALTPIIDELSSVYGIEFSVCRGTERRYVIKNRNFEGDDEK